MLTPSITNFISTHPVESMILGALILMAALWVWENI